mgnify:CR=1 FL=1
MRWRVVWILSKKELRGYFNSMVAYIFVVLFLGFCGFFTWLYGADVFYLRQVTLETFFNFGVYWSFLFLVPMLTMRTFSEEHKTGTIEFILTKPVQEFQLVISKYLGCILAILIFTIPTVIYVISLIYLGKPDGGPIIGGYIALLMLASLYTAIGIFGSSLTENQVVAFLLSIFIIAIIHILLPLLARNATGLIGGLMDYLGVESHYSMLAKGVIDLRDIIYFLTGTGIFLLGAEYSLIRRNIKW